MYNYIIISHYSWFTNRKYDVNCQSLYFRLLDNFIVNTQYNYNYNMLRVRVSLCVYILRIRYYVYNRDNSHDGWLLSIVCNTYTYIHGICYFGYCIRKMIEFLVDISIKIYIIQFQWYCFFSGGQIFLLNKNKDA